jgi:FkbH-like protein
MNRVAQLLEEVRPDRFPDLVEAVRLAEDAAGELADTAGVTVLRNITLENIEPLLKYHLMRAGLRPTIRFGGFDTVAQDILSLGEQDAPPSDALVLALHLEGLAPDMQQPGWRSGPVAKHLEALYGSAAAHGPGLIFINTFLPPFYIHRQPGLDELESEVLTLNQFVRSYVRDHADRFALVDWERLARVLGSAQSMDTRYWYMAAAPFKVAFLEQMAFEVARVIRASRGRTKKCLVLDCDNTLWGGIIGEDGLDRIKLDAHTYPGKAYHDFQQSVLNLVARGTLLALCSKNNEQDVWEALEGHEHGLVRRKHITASRINWDNKVDNLLQLAEELNLGLDSFVFVDDSPVECELIRKALPEVTVLAVPDSLYLLPTLLLRDGYFDQAALTDEDRARAAMYQAEKKRARSREAFRDIETYLADLDLRLRVAPATLANVPRVAQLTQRTNQFNLTTRRYTEHEINELLDGTDAAVYAMTAADRFGDYGLTGVMIARKAGRRAKIDALLVSCRVLGRRLELAFVAQVLAALEKKWDVETWRAAYRPTAKNGQVATFWSRMGFRAAETREAGSDFQADAGAWSVGENIGFIAIEGAPDAVQN